MSAECQNGGSTRFFETGNQVGDLNAVGDLNFVAGGPPGSGLSSGIVTPTFFPPDIISREPWKNPNAKLTQELIDASFPFIELQWVADITLSNGTTFRVSNKNIYVEDSSETPRFYEARVKNSPDVSITLGEWLNPNFQIGDFNLVLNNRDGFFNEFIVGGVNAIQWTGAQVVILVGFGESFTNYFEVVRGFVTPRRGVTSTENEITLKCYDRFEEDNIPVPATVISNLQFPDADPNIEGESIPLLYGDWDTEVGEFGEIPGLVINANESGATEAVVVVSENDLSEIGDVFLHRGNRSGENPEGAVQFLDSAITKEPDKGQIRIPVGSVVLEEVIDVLKSKAGESSAVNFITSESASLNFSLKGVQVGDIVFNLTAGTSFLVIQDLTFTAKSVGGGGNNISIFYTNIGIAGSEGVGVIGTAIQVDVESGVSTAAQLKTAIEGNAAANALISVVVTGTGSNPQTAPVSETFFSGGQDARVSGVVETVSNFNLTLTGGVIFGENDEYLIQSTQYKFTNGDRISLKCKGKNVQPMSINRISDAGLPAAVPIGLSVGTDGTYWFADDTAQKIHQIGLDNVLRKTINYSDIDAGITQVTGLTVQTDNTLWLFDGPLSRVYRFIIEDDALGLTFDTNFVSGLGSLLVDGRGLTIDEANVLYVVDNDNGQYYKIDPFTPFQPTLLAQWNRSVFDAGTTDTTDLSVDPNAGNLALVDRSTGKFYRISRTDGTLVATSDFLVTLINPDLDHPVGVSTAQDGTIFVLNRTDLTLYNYNELSTASDNIGFIVRDLLQSLAGKTTFDFDLTWNQASRDDLDQFRGRLYVSQKTNLFDFINKVLQQFNTAIFAKFGKLSLFHITFDNFKTDGNLLREGDIIEGSFRPSKEYNQYFNSFLANYQRLPFSDKDKLSDTYISSSGIALAGKEIPKTLDMPDVYRRSDMDKLGPLFVRLAAPEPEFLKLDSPFRLIFTQLMQFFQIAFDSPPDCATGLKIGGRRFNLTPAFTREIRLNLDKMTLALKFWSLGSTQFGDFVPTGTIAGGEDDKIVLTTLGNFGYIAPIGTITGSTLDSVTIEDVGGADAETRTAAVVGLAWKPGYKVDVVDAADLSVKGTFTVLSVSGGVITFTANHGLTIAVSVKNLSGFITSGFFLRYTDFDVTTADQKSNYGHYGRPEIGYPATTVDEIAEQKSGLHDFPDNTKPYLLHPSGFTPT